MAVLYCPTAQSEDILGFIKNIPDTIKIGEGCGNVASDKAMILYKILQSGGVAENTWIASDDKDFEPVWETLCRLATSKIMKFHVELWEGKALYSEEEYEKMEAVVEDMRLDFID